MVAYVVPSGGAVHADKLSDGHLNRWENLWSMLYRQENPDDPEFDIRGWNSSYTRMPLPAEEMRDWVDETVRTIEEFGAESILEIGCGSGLLLHRLAPHCRRYVATDFSAAAVDRLQRQVAVGDLPDIVEARQCPAHALDDIASGFDLVVVNSVVQYFPSVAYLDDMIEQALAHTRPGGRVFIGDAYHLSLREAMQASIVAEQSADAPRELLRSRVLHRIASQTELLIDPAYFADLADRSPDVSSVEARPKFGAHANEMTSFRYDAVVHVGDAPAPSVDVPWHDWQGDGFDADSLGALLGGEASGGFGVRRIPNSRVTSWLNLWSSLNGAGDDVAGAGARPVDRRPAGAHDRHRVRPPSELPVRPPGRIDRRGLATG